MAYIPVANVVAVEMLFDSDSQIVENVYHWHFSVNPGITEMATLAAAHKTWWDTNIKAKVNPNTSLILIRTTNLTTQSSPRTEYNTGLPIDGTNANGAMPNNVTVVVKWITEQRGRSFRGRTYHIGLTEDVVTLNSVTTAAVTALVTAYTALMNLTMTPQPEMVVVSRFTNNAPRATGIFTNIVGLSIDPTVDSQRRRLPGRGR